MIIIIITKLSYCHTLALCLEYYIKFAIFSPFKFYVVS